MKVPVSMPDHTIRDFKKLQDISIPARRAAYSDRTALMMAIMAQLAYEPLDEESQNHYEKQAQELAKMSNVNAIIDILKFRQTSFYNPDENRKFNDLLRDALKAGGFELRGTLYSASHDAQGFVAFKAPNKDDPTDMGVAIVSFRGTEPTKVRDWMTNLNIRSKAVSLHAQGPSVGHLHKGFYESYWSLHKQIDNYLKDHRDVPLYITGHSMGGALAVCATWFQASKYLAACYTFGAPRCCDHDLMDKFKTPIYRIVNGADPVPLVPPTGKWWIVPLKVILRTAGTCIPLLGILNNWADSLIKKQAFRHVGYMRYLSMVEAKGGEYPDLKLEFSLSSGRRLYRFWKQLQNGSGKRVDLYHDMQLYIDKLAAYAKKRNPG